MLPFHADVCWGTFPATPHLYDGWQSTRFSTTQEMSSLIDTIVHAMGEWAYPANDTFAVRMVLEEAIVNAIKHGHHNDPGKEVEVRYRLGADHLLFEVEDEGRGFDPGQVPDATAPENLQRPSGRGLLLIRHYSTWVRHNAQGDCIAFCICRSDMV